VPFAYRLILAVKNPGQSTRRCFCPKGWWLPFDNQWNAGIFKNPRQNFLTKSLYHIRGIASNNPAKFSTGDLKIEVFIIWG